MLTFIITIICIINFIKNKNKLDYSEFTIVFLYTMIFDYIIIYQYHIIGGDF